MGNKASRAYGGVGASLLDRTYGTKRSGHHSAAVVYEAKVKFGAYGELSAELMVATEYYDVIDAIQRMYHGCVASMSGEDQKLASKLMNFMIKHKISIQ